MSERDDHGTASSAKRTPDASVTPTAQLPELDAQALAGLRAAGEQWPGGPGDRRARRECVPVDTALDFVHDTGSARGRFLHINSKLRANQQELEATPAGDEIDSTVGRAIYWVRRTIVGPPLRSTAVAGERMSNWMALPVLSPDALSSVAYGPEAMMAVLVLAGSAELKLSLVLGAVIVVLMLAVGLGYRQVIRAYPHGGGSYVVASDSLGPIWGLIAGAGLTLDYIITVAISVASGVAAVTSAIPSVGGATVPIGVGMILLLTAGNLRGARDSGKLFAAPTYLFVIAIAMIVVTGLIHALGHSLHPVAPAPRHATEALGLLLLMKAFASGATAMTGIEVISNAVPVFEPPEAKNAERTLSVMVTLLVSMFIGVVVVAHFDGASPNGSQTVLSEIAHRSVGSGLAYDYVQLATTLVLLIAANSAFNGFPRLLYFVARDNFAPRAFLHMGDRLAFTAGIVVLAIPAALLFVAFGGKTTPLIPLFAVGVFVAFTLAQSAMVRYWLRHREHGWKRALATNLLGAILSGLVVLVAAITKFTAGAWLVVVLIPTIVLICWRIRVHYERARDALRPRPASRRDQAHGVPATPAYPYSQKRGTEQADQRNLIIVPVAVLDLAALRALTYAADLSLPVVAVHVSPSDEEAERFLKYWREWGDHLPLEVISSPYRATLAPLTNYVQALHSEHPEITITVVVPELIVARVWHQILHNRVPARLRNALLHEDGIIITSVPFQLPG